MIAKFERINKTFFTSAGTFITNDKTSVNLNKGEVLVITSQSVNTNEPLLTLMGCLIHPTEGIIEVSGKSCTPSNLKEIALVKSQIISFIFQRDNFLKHLNTEENVAFQLKVQKIKATEIKQRTTALLKKVNMYEHRKKMIWQLTHFEKKQIAIAQALITNPQIIVCDKPTALLDRYSGSLIMKMLKDIASQGKAIAIINHDTRYNEFADRAVQIKKGIVTELLIV